MRTLHILEIGAEVIEIVLVDEDGKWQVLKEPPEKQSHRVIPFENGPLLLCEITSWHGQLIEKIRPRKK